MKTIRVLLVISLVTIGSLGLKAQSVLDGVYEKQHTPARKPIPYTPLREADVMWSKRIWRMIDLREKINHTMYYPEEPVNGRASLFDVIKKQITGEAGMPFLIVSSTDEDFREAPMTQEEVKKILVRVVPTKSEDPDNPGQYFYGQDTTEISSKDVMAYEIKEDWFLDRQRSVLDVRIIGIAPIIVKRDEEGAERGLEKLFWLYFPSCRNVFANAEVFNRYNDAERRTYEDIFWKRMFSSYVTKESNVYNRRIADYQLGLDALIEAENIKNKIFEEEINLWHY